MKQGISKGYNANCCDGLEIWGVSCTIPHFGGTIDGISGSSATQNAVYDMGGRTVSPTLYPSNVNGVWYMYAAKVPGTYPGPVGQERPTSSRSTGEWAVPIGTCGNHFVDTEFGDNTMYDVSHVKGSRAIYIDGQQSLVTYRVSTKTDADFDQAYPDDTHGTDLGDHYQIAIGSQVATLYRVGSLNHKMFDGPSLSNMEKDWSSSVNVLLVSNQHSNVLRVNSTANGPQTQLPVNAQCFSPNYYIVSSYQPGKTKWSVGRVKYEGTRSTNGSGGTESGLEVFCTENDGLAEWLGDVEETYTGNYWVCLPAARSYVDSSAPSPDECWVVALHKDNNTESPDDERIVTGRWLSKVYSPGDSSPWTGYADGTLHSSEIENVILDVGDSELASHYPDEDWNNIRIRSYNRVYDPTTGHSRDLVLFTVHDEEGFVETDSDVIATFEGGDLNTGLDEAGIAFQTGGQASTSGWVSSASVSYSTDNPINGSYSAKTDPVDSTLDQTLFLKITFSKVDPGYIEFNYRHHNRIWGTPGSGTGTQLFNFPVPENYLDIRLDGSLLTDAMLIDEETAPGVGNYVAEVDNGSGWVALPTSRIDNLNSPEDATGDADKFLDARPIRIWLKPGTHTLTFNARRAVDSNGGSLARTYSQIDNLDLGILMIGEDPTGKRPYLFNGEKVQAAEWWAWPLRDDENEEPLSGRYSVVPDFITLDKLGRILYGNPHYVVRLVPNEDDEGYWKLDTTFGNSRGAGYGDDDDKGYLRWTATDAKNVTGVSGEPTCEDPDLAFDYEDTIADPPWGAFQIIPIGDYGAFQIRGANASMRDATILPFLPEDYPIDTTPPREEFFLELLKPQDTVTGFYWAQRPHSWTVADDGHYRRPHLEIVWRPTRYGKAYPTGPWNSPPYKSNFGDLGGDDTSDPDELLPRDRFNISATSSKPRWSTTNKIISTTYSDALTQSFGDHGPMQAVWSWRDDLDDPESDPDVEGPRPSARRRLYQANHVPTGKLDISYTCTIELGCDGTDDDFVPIFRANVGLPILNVDFDAVDVEPCSCE